MTKARPILIGGIVASLVIAMWEMDVEAIVPGGAGFFGPPLAIGATVARGLQGSANPIPFDLAALVLGLAGHMMNSVVLAAVFGVLASRARIGTAGTAGAVMAGAVWGILVFVGMWFVVVPLVDPLVRNLNAVVFLAGHVMWGVAVGLLWARSGPEQLSVSHRPA